MGGAGGAGVLICWLTWSFDHWPRIPFETEVGGVVCWLRQPGWSIIARSSRTQQREGGQPPPPPLSLCLCPSPRIFKYLPLLFISLFLSLPLSRTRFLFLSLYPSLCLLSPLSHLWSRGRMASGVISRRPNPVPPDVRTRSTESSSHHLLIIAYRVQPEGGRVIASCMWP